MGSRVARCLVSINALVGLDGAGSAGLLGASAHDGVEYRLHSCPVTCPRLAGVIQCLPFSALPLVVSAFLAYALTVGSEPVFLRVNRITLK